ncbi:MAG: hypothetical protein IKY02_02875, partial [Lachnospiraceae bacterium]|nr:hypothetical protein [Lachnospiraceae bacterium]
MKSSLLNRVLSVLCTFSLIFTTASPVSLAGSLKSESGRRSVSSVSEEADLFLRDDPSLPGLAATMDSPLRSYFSDEIPEAKDDTIQAEILEKRDPFSKHFRLTDGSYAAVTYDHQIHERIGAEETYREIDNRLVKTKSQDGLFVYTKQTPGFVQAVFSAEPSDPGLLSGKLLTLQDGE